MLGLRRFLLASAVALSSAGAGAVVFMPADAGAGVTPGVKPDFVVGPGDTVPQQFARPLVGSVEVRSNPDDCRNNPAIGLTCAAHRLKVKRAPAGSTYKLNITLEWTAQGNSAVAQVPDVDMYLFDGPTAKFDSTQVGGAGATMPERITLTPTEDEYDIVVQAYAGAITGYKITVAYTQPTGAKDSLTPDIVLKPHGAPFVKEYTTAMAGGDPVAVQTHWPPSQCRDATTDALCDVYRIKVERNKSKEAVNFVVVQLDWQPVVVPALDLVAIALVSHPAPDLNMFVWDTPDKPMEGIGGTSIENVPERLGFIATQDEFDLTVQSALGPATNYKLTAFMTDEIAAKPFELLDPVTGQPLVQQPDGTITPIDATGDQPAIIPELALAPIDTDTQIAGIGLGTTEQFDAEEAIRLGQQAIRNTSISTDPPSGLALVLLLVVTPAALLAGGVAIVRRRHSAIF